MLNPKFGASILSWIPPVWTSESGLYAIKKTAEAGFDLLEILLPVSMDFDAETVKKQLKENNIEAVCSLNLPKNCHIPFHPLEATTLIKAALDKAAILEVPFLGGVLHAGIGVFTGLPRTKEEEVIICQVWAEVSAHAQNLGIKIGIEPVNRYESYICTAASETLTLLRKTNASNLGLHLDTFHMNIEEANFYDPVIQANEKLFHVHMTESDRGMLGEGNVHWDELFKALSEISYSGALVLENFSSEIKELIGPTSLWRPSKYNAEDLAKGSLAFMKKMVEKYN
jgi:D-psicose/D-tagatose/L-ribulose 3-epimerase